MVGICNWELCGALVAFGTVHVSCSLVVGDFMLQVIGRSILIISKKGKGNVQVDKPQHKKEGSEDLHENS